MCLLLWRYGEECRHGYEVWRGAANADTNNDHDEPQRRLIQERNITPIEERHTKKETRKMIKHKTRAIKNEDRDDAKSQAS